MISDDEMLTHVVRWLVLTFKTFFRYDLSVSILYAHCPPFPCKTLNEFLHLCIKNVIWRRHTHVLCVIKWLGEQWVKPFPLIYKTWQMVRRGFGMQKLSDSTYDSPSSPPSPVVKEAACMLHTLIAGKPFLYEKTRGKFFRRIFS